MGLKEATAEAKKKGKDGAAIEAKKEEKERMRLEGGDP